MLPWWVRQIFRKRPAGAVQRTRSPKRQLRLVALEERSVPAFLAPVNYSAGTSPGIMTSGDFNGDGKLDLVAANNSATPTVSVLLGNGDGTFQAPLASNLGGTPGSPYTGAQGHTMAVADFNGDGKKDLAVVSGFSAMVLVGNGDGTFQAPRNVVLGPTPTRISAADVNGDGHADLLAANTNGTVSVLLGNGDGTFAPYASYLAGNDMQDVKAADLNGDGKLDLVAANGISAGSVDVLMGNGDGTFQPYQAYAAFSAPYELELGDFNGDGHTDVAVPNSYTSSYVTYLPGNGDGTFGASQSYNVGTQPWDIETGDFNNDGRLDLIEGNASAGYEIQTGNGDGTFTLAPNQASPNGADFAVGDFNGDGATDVAGANSSGTVSVLINTNNGVLNLAGATGLRVTTAATTTTAGAALAVTVSAVDSSGNVATGYQDIVRFSSSDLQAGLPANYTFTPGDAGTHTFLVALKTAGTQSITATDTAHATVTGTEAGITVTPAAASKIVVGYVAPLVVGGGPQLTAGQVQYLNVWASDPYGNAAVGYTGTVNFTSTDPRAVLPPSYTFTGDGAVQRFAVSFGTAGTQTVSVTDAASPTITGKATFTVGAAAATSLTLSGGGGAIDAAHAVTVTARDGFGNVATGFNDVVHLTSSDPATTVSADAALVNGVGTFLVTPMTLGTQTLTAADVASPSIAGSEAIDGTVGWASRFTMTPLAGVAAGTSQTFTITAYDVLGDVSTVYAGTVVFSSSDVQAGLPPSYTFTAADAGSHTFSVTFRTAGTQSLTVRDSANAGAASQSGIAVTPGAAASISVTPLHGVVAGTAQTFTVTARDAFGNLATGYTGTVAFSTSDTLADLPPSYTFTAADAGTHTFSVMLKSSGGQTFAVQDVANPTNLALGFSQRDILVTPAAVSGFAFKGTSLSNMTAGQTFGATVSAVDAFGNAITGYTGTAVFSSSDAQAGLPASYTFTAADAGAHAFNFTLKTAGSQSITATDAANAALTGSLSSVLVKAAAASTLAAASPASATAGVAQSFTVSALDVFGNVASSYLGTVTFSSSDAQAGLPASYTFTSKDSGAHTFSVVLKTAGTQSVTVTDAANGFTATQSGIGVAASAAAGSFLVAGFPATTAGAAQSFTVTVKDAFGNLATGYTGTVTFSSSDAQAGLPASYTFTAADNGSHTFTATLKTAGTQSITVKDAANPAATGTEAGIAVSAAVATTATAFTVTGFPATTAGAARTFTVTARDAYGNVVTGYTGTVTFSSSDAQAGLPASYTFTVADNGSHTFIATLKTAGTQSITVKDAANPAIAGTETGIAVSAGAVAQAIISAPSTVTQGVGFKFTVTMVDAYGNVVTGYRGKVHLSSSDAKGGTSDYTFSNSDNGVHVFSYTFNALGYQTLTITDSTTGAVLGTATVYVAPK